MCLAHVLHIVNSACEDNVYVTVYNVKHVLSTWHSLHI